MITEIPTMDTNTSITAHRMFVNTHQTYDVQFYTDYIFTTVTANPAVVTDWIDNINHPNGLTVGLDIEWRPSFTSQPNPVATLQLCVRDRCLIFQFLHSNNQIPQSLANFLSSEYNFITFVGVGVKTDLQKLQRDHGIGGGASYVDLGERAAEVYGMMELKSKSLKDLAYFVLRKEMEKPQAVRMSWWDQRWLTLEQVKYACLDAYVSFEIGRALGLCNFGNYYYGNSGYY